jgi:hypothetical protein
MKYSRENLKKCLLSQANLVILIKISQKCWHPWDKPKEIVIRAKISQYVVILIKICQKSRRSDKNLPKCYHPDKNLPKWRHPDKICQKCRHPDKNLPKCRHPIGNPPNCRINCNTSSAKMLLSTKTGTIVALAFISSNVKFSFRNYIIV